MSNKADLLIDSVKKAEKESEDLLSVISAEKEYVEKAKQYLEKESIQRKKYDLLVGVFSNPVAEEIDKLIEINTKLLLPFLNGLPSQLEKMELKTFKIDELEISEEQKTKKIFDGLKSSLDSKKQDSLLKDYIEKDEQEQEYIDKMLSSIKGENKDEEKKIALIKNEIKEFKETLKKENATLLSIKKGILPSIMNRLFKHNYDAHDDLIELKTLYAKESEEHNKILSALGNLKLGNGESKTQQIKIFEGSEISLDTDLKLLLNQFVTPKLPFKSGKFICFKTDWQEASNIIKSGNLGDASPFRGSLIVGNQETAVKYAAYKIDSVTGFSGEIYFVVPLEKAFNSFFIRTGNMLKIFFPTTVDQKTLSEGKSKVDLLKKDLKDRKEDYIKQSQKLDEDFKEKWSTDAEDMINDNFVMRWLNGACDDFRLRNDFDAVSLLLGMVIFESKVPLSKENAYEDLKKKSKKEFDAMVTKLKSFYESIITDSKKIAVATPLDTSCTLILIPRKYVMYYEKLIKDMKKRPKILYYDSTPDIKNIVTKVNTVKKINPDIKTSKLRIFDKETMQPAETSL